MAISIGNVSHVESASWLQEPTFNHTVEAGDNKVLVVVTAQSDQDSSNKTLSYVKWNGDSMIKIANLGGDHSGRLYMWYILNPDEGSHAITTLWNASVKMVAVAITLLGVDLTNALRGYEIASTTGTSLSDTITSSPSDVVLSALDIYSTKQNITANTGQTSIIEDLYSNTNNCGVSYETGAASSVLGWSWSSSAEAYQILASFKAVTTGLPGVATINGIANADIKTINGIAVANIKSLQGLT